MAFKIAITGATASGKTTVATLLSELLNCRNYSADKIVADFYANAKFCHESLREFSQIIFDNRGLVDKKKLKEWIISEPKNLSLISKIVWIEFEKKVQEIFQSDENTFVIFEIPLLFESNIQNLFNFVINVESDLKIQSERATNLSGIEKRFFEIFIENQVSNELREKNSNFTIKNFGKIEELKCEIKKLSVRLKAIARFC